MSKKETKQQQNSPKNNKFFSMDNIAGIIACAAVIIVALYVISTHLNLPVVFVPDDAVEVTYPAFIFEGGVEEMADSMKGSDGVYRVKVNSDGSLSVKLSPERHQKIKDAAKNNLESLMLISIGEETAVKEYSANEDFTVFEVTAVEDHENLENEISNAVYCARLYHICHMNNDVELTFNYTDSETGRKFRSEYYDIEGKSKVTNDYWAEKPTSY